MRSIKQPVFAQKSIEMVLMGTIKNVLKFNPEFCHVTETISNIEIVSDETNISNKQNISPLQKIAFIVEYLLSPRFNQVAGYTLSVVAVFIEQLNTDHFELIVGILNNLILTRKFYLI